MPRRQLAEWISRAVIGSALTAAYFHAASATSRDAYRVQVLTADRAASGVDDDANLVNGWGLAAAPAGPWWVASNGMRLGLVISADGAPGQPRVDIPGPPTGVAFNAGAEFRVTDGVDAGPSRFLFATEDGVIAGWSPDVPPSHPSTKAFVVVDNAEDGAVYKGLALAVTESGARLYAADFRNGRIDVFDGNFDPVESPGAFEDPRLPDGLAPFNIEALNGRLFVAYARRDPATNDEIKGQGFGAVNVFDTDGRLVARVATRGALNAPWGMTITPSGFGDLAGDLLVGNFGDGKILAFRMTDDMKKFTPAGVMRDERRKEVVIDGLWGIGFGNGHLAGPTDTLFFAAGPHDEELGAFGTITTAPAMP
jgi:uncharacterized protein (TIGR03118 family)